MAAFQTPIPDTYRPTPADPNLFYDTATGTWMQRQAAPTSDPNQWSWGDQGLLGMGGSTPVGIDTSFLTIDPRYASGAPITAPTWQDAVRNSLTGFVRSNYGVDPIFNWNQQSSGNNGSQFRLGTFQELANQYPGFFDTQGGLVRNSQTGEIQANHGFGTTFDPLLGLNPTDKVLGFEDIPFQQIEKVTGNLPGQFLNPAFIKAVAPVVDEYRNVSAQLTKLQQDSTKGTLTPEQQNLYNQLNQRRMQLEPILNSNAYQGINHYATAGELAAQPGGKDFNDLLFKLDLSQYAPPAPITTANPRAVMSQFFNTAPYQLAFGSNPDTLNPNLSPTQRFQADPGYQFIQDEGKRQLQMDQAKRGLLESGRGQRDMQQFGQGVADQNFQRYQGQVQGLFKDWQNGIAGIASQGAAATGQMAQNDTGLAQLLAGLSSNTGNSLGNLSGQTGTNIANLFGNQGSFGGSAFLNTGAAQGSNVMSSASLAAQIQAAQIQAQAQKDAASSSAMGQIAGSAMSMLGSFI